MRLFRTELFHDSILQNAILLIALAAVDLLFHFLNFLKCTAEEIDIFLIEAFQELGVEEVVCHHDAVALGDKEAAHGKYVAVVGRDGDDYAEIAEHLTAGKNTVTLRVCASFRNIYGPYLNYMDQTVATWSDFEVYREGEVALASEYSMIDYGLYEAPELYINK